MRLASPVLRSMLVGFLSIAFNQSAVAQTSNATLHGTIIDSGGGVLPGVTVKLQSHATGSVREAVTNAAGVYVFNFLAPGEYELTWVIRRQSLDGSSTARLRVPDASRDLRVLESDAGKTFRMTLDPAEVERGQAAIPR